MAVSIAPESLGAVPGPRTQRQKDDDLLRQMETLRDRKIPMWRECQAYIVPYTANVVRQSDTAPAVPADILDESIFYCWSTFKSFLASSLTNPSRIWSEWTLPDPDAGESAATKDWLHTVNTRRMTVLSQSNFYEVMNWVYGEWPVFSTAVVLIEEDERDLFRYVPWEIGSYAIADDARGNPIALSRRFTMTVRQLVERFGTRANGTIDTSVFSRPTRDLIAAGQWERQIEVAHMIAPNDEYRPGSKLGRYLPFASRYWEYGSKDEDNGGYLAREGYHEWPAMVFRWARLASDPWGTAAPGYLTLGAVKSAQAMESDLLMMVETSVKPALQVPTGLVNASLLPAAINKVDMRPGVAASPIHKTEPMAIQQARDSQDRLNERLYALWYTRLILSSNATDTARRGASTQPRTAREIEEISAEKYQILGPVVEAAAPAFRAGSDREFGILQRRGMLPPPPPEIEGMPLAIEYTSSLGIAQRSVGLASLVQYGMTQADLFRVTQDPGVLMRTNWSELAQAIGDRSGLPPKVQRSDDEVQEMLDAQAQAVAAQQQAEQRALEAKTVRDLGAAPMGEDTALTRVTESGAFGAAR